MPTWKCISSFIFFSQWSFFLFFKFPQVLPFYFWVDDYHLVEALLLNIFVGHRNAVKKERIIYKVTAKWIRTIPNFGFRDECSSALKLYFINYLLCILKELSMIFFSVTSTFGIDFLPCAMSHERFSLHFACSKNY